ncbi:MAG TPA: hypothetical protein VF491_06930, partial [Vicinamibacterales bacterium]
ELLSGTRPFAGASSPALLSAILRDPPSSICERRPDVPGDLERLIQRLLEKHPEDRVQTARDVFNELRHVRKQIESGGRPPAPHPAASEHPWIAVLPFGTRGVDVDAEAIAAGLTDDIASGLAKFPGLSIVATQSARAFKDSPLDIKQIAERLHARYLITGHVRKSGRTLRTTAQVIDGAGGEPLWTENYDRQLDASELFEIQDDLTNRIVATTADRHGVLARAMVQAVQSVPIADATFAQLLVHTWGFQQRPLPALHAELRGKIESRLAVDSAHATLWSELANLYVLEHALWFNPLPDPLSRAVTAARRAIELDRSNQNGWLWLAIAHFFLRDAPAFEEAREHALRINPCNAEVLAWLGNITTGAGDFERGCALTERAMALNPAHPGWLHFAHFNRHFAGGEFRDALQAAKRVNMRDYFWMHYAIAAACGHLGLEAEGRAAAREMVRLAPFLEHQDNVREFVTRWYWPEDLIESLLDGVRQSMEAAGNEPARPASASTTPKPRPSSSSAGSATLSVAVLPFVPRSSDDESRMLADGLTDAITSGLSRFSYIRVLPRAVVERQPRERAFKPAGARYAVEGQVRKAGQAIRVTVAVVDTETATTLWTSSYDRDSKDGTFALQDDIASVIVSSLGDHTGVLMRAIATLIADKPVEELSVAELAVWYHVYSENLRSEEHLRVRDALEKAVEREPRAVEAWVRLAMLYEHEYTFGFNPKPDPLGRHRHAAERAIALDRYSQEAWVVMASAHKFARDLTAMKAALEQALTLNPLNSDVVAVCGLYLSLVGEIDRAAELMQRAIKLKPQHPGWYYHPLFNIHFSRGDYEAALRDAKAVNMPTVALPHFAAASVAGHLGRGAEARAALAAIRKISPALINPAFARAGWSVLIWDSAMVDKLVEGFEKSLKLDEAASSA